MDLFCTFLVNIWIILRHHISKVLSIVPAQMFPDIRVHVLLKRLQVCERDCERRNLPEDAARYDGRAERSVLVSQIEEVEKGNAKGASSEEKGTWRLSGPTKKRT
jgi:hypothetical protein